MFNWFRTFSPKLKVLFVALPFLFFQLNGAEVNVQVDSNPNAESDIASLLAGQALSNGKRLSGQFQLPSDAALNTWLQDRGLDSSHKAALIECIEDFHRALEAIVNSDPNLLNKVVEAQATVAMLKVARLYIQTQKYNNQSQQQRPEVVRRLRAWTTGSSDARNQAADSLYRFYEYIQYGGYKDPGVPNPFPAGSGQAEILGYLKTYGQRHFRNKGASERRYTLNDGDIYILQNLYSSFDPDQRPAATFMDRLYQQLGRSFFKRDMNRSNKVSVGEQMDVATATFDEAKDKFVRHVRDQIGKFLRNESPFNNSPHNCRDFLNADDTNLLSNLAASPFCRAGDVVGDIFSQNPLEDIQPLMDYINPAVFDLSGINPHVHGRRLYHNLLSCRIERRNGDWWVDMNIYLEHLHGNSRGQANFFVNTGKRISESNLGGQNYNQCNLDSNVNSYSQTNFALSDNCIDRPLYHTGSHRHEFETNIAVNIGDTRQDHITLVGTSEPNNQRGITIRNAGANGRPSSQVPHDTTQDNLVMTREEQLSQCSGYQSYTQDASSGGSDTVQSLIVIPLGENNGLTRDTLDVMAKTQPVFLTRGTYRWTCKDPSQITDPVEREQACNLAPSQYQNDQGPPTRLRRLSQAYTMTVQYYSSVQKEESPTAEIEVPARAPIEIAWVPDETQPSTESIKYLKLVNQSQEFQEIVESGTLSWDICPEGHDFCSSAPVLGNTYPFQTKDEAYPVDVKWQLANWNDVHAVTSIARSPVQTILEPGEDSESSLMIKAKIEAPQNVIEQYKASAKWKCTEGAPEGCNGKSATGDFDSFIPFNKTNDNYSVQIYIEVDGNEMFHSNIVPVQKIPIVPFEVILTADDSVPADAEFVKLKAEVRMRDGESGEVPPKKSFEWVCPGQEIEWCTGEVGEGFKQFNKREGIQGAYNVTAVYTTNENPEREATSGPYLVNPFEREEVDFSVEWKIDDEFSGEDNQLRAGPYIVSTNQENKPTITEFTVTCQKVNETDDVEVPCESAGQNIEQAYDVDGNLATWTRLEEGSYKLVAQAKDEEGRTRTKDLPIVPNTDQQQVNLNLTVTVNEEKCVATPTLTVTGDNQSEAALKWICEGDSAPEDCASKLIESGSPTEFNRVEGSTHYTIKVQYIENGSNQVLAEQSANCDHSEEDDIQYRIRTKNDRTPDEDKATIPAEVRRIGSTEDASDEGRIEWVWDNDEGEEQKAEGKVLEAARSNKKTLTGVVTFYPEREGSRDVTANFRIKPNCEDVDSDGNCPEDELGEDEGIPPLPDIPPSPAPPRFQPTILPPRPGPYIKMGFP